MIDLNKLQPSDRTRIIITGVCLSLALIFLFLSWGSRSSRPLKPLRTTNTDDVLFVSNEATFVTFSELNADPASFANQIIRVSGSYEPVAAPTCLPHNGPGIRWSLVNEELRLEATGFETLMREVPPGTILTVDGIWRLYHGPYGCGKEPPANDVWYLEVTQIIQPNPLFGADAIALDTILGPTPTPTGPIPPTSTGLPPTETATITDTTATETPTFIFTPTPTPLTAVTLAPSPTVDPLTTATPSLTPTTTPSPTATGTTPANVTVTATPTSGPVVPTAVQPTVPYQGPLPTATPSNPYP